MRNRQGTRANFTTRARELRRDMTPAEKLLWRYLRAKSHAGPRFRRQEPVGNFIADFFCASARLIVELDGSSHEGRETRDTQRDEILKSEGYIVLRFRNEDVFHNLHSVLETIDTYCGWGDCPHPNPLPEGEGA